MGKNAILALVLAVTGMAGALAQPPGKIYRLGVLTTSQPAATWRSAPQLRSFLEGLQQLGYVEGQNLAIEYRSAESKIERLPELATELLALKVDVLWGRCACGNCSLHARWDEIGYCSDRSADAQPRIIASGTGAAPQRPHRSSLATK